MDREEEQQRQSDSAAFTSDRPSDMDVVLDSIAESEFDAGDASMQLSTGFSTIASIALIAIFGKPFLESFATELGRRLGGTAADWMGRIHARIKRDGSAVTGFVVDGWDERTTFEVSEPLTEEAKLALLDLDAYAVRGQTLRWNADSKVWDVVGGPSSFAERPQG